MGSASAAAPATGAPARPGAPPNPVKTRKHSTSWRHSGTANSGAILRAMPLLLAEPDLASLLAMEDLIPLMERTLVEYSAGRASQPVRTVLSLDRHQAFLAVM